MKICKSYERAGKELEAPMASRDVKLESLLRSHEAQARQFASGLARNSEEAKELVQAASFQVLRHWEKRDPLKSFAGWYLTIVRNLFLDSRRAAKRTVSISQSIDGEAGGGLLEILADGGLGVLEQMERGELAEALRDSLNALGKKYRVVVRLCDLEGMTYEDAARKLGIPVGTLRSRLCRARAALRRNPRLQQLA
jgi:RNA polymerase sigma-70 factor (ECF subfamily)